MIFTILHFHYANRKERSDSGPPAAGAYFSWLTVARGREIFDVLILTTGGAVWYAVSRGGLAVKID